MVPLNLKAQSEIKNPQSEIRNSQTCATHFPSSLLISRESFRASSVFSVPGGSISKRFQLGRHSIRNGRASR